MDIALDINLTSLIIQISATIILIIAAWRFFAEPMRNYMEKRHQFIQSSFDEAEKQKIEAAKTTEELNEELRKFKTESQEMLQTASAKAEEKAQAILQEAKERAESEAERARVMTERERQQMLEMTRAEIRTITKKATEKLIKKEVDLSVHDNLFDEFVKLGGGVDES